MCALSALNSGVTCRDVQSLWAGADTMNWLYLQRGKKRRPPASHITRQLPVNETQICLMSSTIEAHTHFFFSLYPSIYNSLHLNLSHGFSLPRVRFFSCSLMLPWYNDDRNSFVILYKYTSFYYINTPRMLISYFLETVNPVVLIPPPLKPENLAC